MKTQTFHDGRGEDLHQAGVSEHAGFPNPAMDRTLEGLDINRLLIQHSAATYLMRIEGNEWRHQGILDGDIVIVDRALDARTNDLIVWWQGENFTISHLNQLPQHTPMWGVISATIHQFRNQEIGTSHDNNGR